MSHPRFHLILAVLLFVTAAAPAERSAVNAANDKPSDNLSESGYGLSESGYSLSESGYSLSESGYNLSESGYGAWSNIAVKASGAFDFIEPDPSGELPKELHESGNTFEP